MSLTLAIIGPLILVRHKKKKNVIKSCSAVSIHGEKPPPFFHPIQIQSGLAVPLLSQGKLWQKCDGRQKEK